MKKPIAFIVLFAVFLVFSCSPNSEISPSNSVTSTSPSTSTSKAKPLINGKAEIPGLLTWDPTNQNWWADFGFGGYLTFSGPAQSQLPLNNSPQAVFHVLSTDYPPSSGWVTDGPLVNQFSVTVVVNDPGAYGTDVIMEQVVELVAGAPQYYQAQFESSTTINGPISITLSGNVVYYLGNYYAVATNYQFPNQPQLPVPGTTSSNYNYYNLTTQVVNGSTFNVQFYYALANPDKTNSNNWFPISGNVAIPYPNPFAYTYYYFQAVITDAPGNANNAAQFQFVLEEGVKNPLSIVTSVRGMNYNKTGVVTMPVTLTTLTAEALSPYDVQQFYNNMLQITATPQD